MSDELETALHAGGWVGTHRDRGRQGDESAFMQRQTAAIPRM